MGTLKNAVHLLAKRPWILVLTIILSSLICVVEFICIIPLYGIAMFKSGSPFDDYINIIQFVIDTIIVPQTAVYIIIVLVILIVVVALILALILAGYFNILNNAIEGKSRKSGSEFIEGVKKYFLRMVSLNLWILCSIVIFIIYVLIASIPAAIVLDNAFSGTINIIAGILLSLITILVLFFSFAFFRQYIAFWYPASIVYNKNHFKIAKKISDSNFWTLLSRFIVFDVIFLIFDAVYIIANFSLANAQVVSVTTSYILLFINIIFKTIYIALLVCFVFSSFKKCNAKYQSKLKART
jgi:hypothetical protein